MNKELIEKFKQYLQKKKKPYVNQICVDLGLQEYDVYGLVEMLKNEGYLYDIIDDKIIKVKPIKESELYQIPNNLDHLKLLLISDTHLASKYDRLDILNRHDCLRYLYIYPLHIVLSTIGRDFQL